jgi:hypothetical protein
MRWQSRELGTPQRAGGPLSGNSEARQQAPCGNRRVIEAVQGYRVSASNPIANPA